MADYGIDDPKNISKRNIAWLKSKEQDGMPYGDVLNFCHHGFMVGKPRAKKAFEDGHGCECPLELMEDGKELPKGYRI